uniref:MazG nucleotide pyrophosphohydrolase domain-containing protein n=1 Tax=Bacillus safensis TaxID=561879 RepID=UPI00240D9306
FPYKNTSKLFSGMLYPNFNLKVFLFVSLYGVSPEMGDVLANLLILADLYDVTVEEVFSAHQQKLTKRFSGEKEPVKNT